MRRWCVWAASLAFLSLELAGSRWCSEFVRAAAAGAAPATCPHVVQVLYCPWPSHFLPVRYFGVADRSRFLSNRLAA